MKENYNKINTKCKTKLTWHGGLPRVPFLTKHQSNFHNVTKFIHKLIALKVVDQEGTSPALMTTMTMCIVFEGHI